jgi:hypothetical protein
LLVASAHAFAFPKEASRTLCGQLVNDAYLAPTRWIHRSRIVVEIAELETLLAEGGRSGFDEVVDFEAVGAGGDAEP